MIVDCHTHIKPTAEDTGTSEHHAAAETVDVCIVLATSNGPSEEVNKQLSQYVSKHKEKMVGFAVVEPGKDKISTNHLKSIPDKLGLKGMVLYCSACGFHPTHSRAMRFYESAQELDLPVFFHNSRNPLGGDTVLEYAQPFLLDEVAREFANLKIIIGNMGVPFVEQTLAMVGRHKNVYADLTIHPSRVWQTYNMVVAAYENGVMDKLLFGSGFPTASAGQCIETLLGFNMLLADTNLPTVPRGNIRNIIERDTLELLGIKEKSEEPLEEQSEKTKGRKSSREKKEKRKKDKDD
ncbi:MAG: amidohydrolase family protein [Planctomycetota bacterium]|jgi:predicted TIM-barrel fold metal-dependent hydrolase